MYRRDADVASTAFLGATDILIGGPQLNVVPRVICPQTHCINPVAQIPIYDAEDGFEVLDALEGAEEPAPEGRTV